MNGYGLFRVMTKDRREIVLEGSADGVEWLPYEFKWKPGDVKRAPGWCAPHQPRLDWQMWFAALESSAGKSMVCRANRQTIAGVTRRERGYLHVIRSQTSRRATFARCFIAIDSRP